jgi:glycosyltransferase involved in cell wall biosynthesis
MQAMNRNECKLRLGISGNSNFLWVGRLNANKDPVTVLKGFSIYLQENPQAKLYMIYQTTELLLSIETMIGNDPVLAEAVLLLGEKKERELPGWYSAADFFISGSHSEGSGYALVEAMHCGSIPVVTSIPSFKRLTANGQYGFLYEKGNAKDLANTLKKLSEISQEDFSKKVLHYAKSNLSFKNIADELFALCSRLAAVKR